MKAYESLGVSAEDYLEAIFVLERQLALCDPSTWRAGWT